MGPSQKERFCEGNNSCVADSLCVVEHDSFDHSDYRLQLFPKNVKAGDDPRLRIQELSKLTHRLVALVGALCVLVVALVLGNVHLQMRVSGLEEMVSGMKSELDAPGQMNPAAVFDQQSKWPAPDSQHRVTPLVSGRIPTRLQQSGRLKRSAGQCQKFSVRKLLDDYCENKKEKEEIKVSNQSLLQLQVALFEAVFDSKAMSEHQRNSDRKDPNCFNSVPVELCAGNTVKYPREGMRLHVFSRNDSDTSNIAVLKDGITFVIKTAGIYLINLNVSMIDNTSKSYLGLYMNNRISMACPEGGVKCSTNYKGSSDYRICNINGVLKLGINDTIDIRTMQGNTVIRIANESNSYFTIALLQKL